MLDIVRTSLVDNYMRRAIAQFNAICKYDFSTTGDDENRVFNVDVPDEDLYEIEDIISHGMVVQWLRPYLYRQENLENFINTNDFTAYSPANLLSKVGDAYKEARREFTNMMREYSYKHGDLTDLHL